ncbi:hypothetical protein H9P43_001793 [Blastocladiella emersonii ATCC 22665]|nr:hypothetical protein H9P43_001793 [Blastocladiella emersonii ATCC 22665]
MPVPMQLIRLRVWSPHAASDGNPVVGNFRPYQRLSAVYRWLQKEHGFPAGELVLQGFPPRRISLLEADPVLAAFDLGSSASLVFEPYADIVPRGQVAKPDWDAFDYADRIGVPPPSNHSTLALTVIVGTARPVLVKRTVPLGFCTSAVHQWLRDLGLGTGLLALGNGTAIKPNQSLLSLQALGVRGPAAVLRWSPVLSLVPPGAVDPDPKPRKPRAATKCCVKVRGALLWIEFIAREFPLSAPLAHVFEWLETLDGVETLGTLAQTVPRRLLTKDMADTTLAALDFGNSMTLNFESLESIERRMRQIAIAAEDERVARELDLRERAKATAEAERKKAEEAEYLARIQDEIEEDRQRRAARRNRTAAINATPSPALPRARPSHRIEPTPPPPPVRVELPSLATVRAVPRFSKTEIFIGNLTHVKSQRLMMAADATFRELCLELRQKGWAPDPKFNLYAGPSVKSQRFSLAKHGQLTLEDLGMVPSATLWYERIL